MLVTTAHNETPALIAKAQQFANRYRCTYYARNQRSIGDFLQAYDAQGVFIVSDKEINYSDRAGERLYFHPSMAMVRLKRMRNGEVDAMIRHAEVQSGDHILDCTAGLGADAIVFAHAVGKSGKVTALESEAIPHIILQEGIVHYQSDVPELMSALQGIRTEYGNYVHKLRDLPDKSYDIVYFDPMFMTPAHKSAAINPLRQHVNTDQLDEASVHQAKRVARKTVVLKDHKNSPVFQRLGFTSVYKKQNHIAYGVITI